MEAAHNELANSLSELEPGQSAEFVGIPVERESENSFVVGGDRLSFSEASDRLWQETLKRWNLR